MQNPGERDSDTRLRDTMLPPFEPLQDASLEPIETAEAPYKKEPLFNKKVMLVWAIGAAVVWFAVSFVLPIAFESAKMAIVQSIKEAEGTGSNVIIERDGQKITIRTKTATPAATPPAAGTPAATAAPPVPAQPIKPVQPAQGPKKSEPVRR